MSSPVPYCTQCDGSEPTYSSRQFRQSYIGAYSSIRNVDFLNLKVRAHRNQHHNNDDPEDHYSEKPSSVFYLGGDAAIVLNSWTDGGGSSSQGMFATVFTLEKRRVHSVQTIACDTHFQAGGPTESFDPAANTFTIRSAHYIPGDSHCCVSAMDVVTFRWNGSHLIQTAIQTELSDYGNSEGTILPR